MGPAGKASRQERALLVVSFGTAHEQTRRLTIDAIEGHLAEAFPDRRLYRAWTSGFLVKRLRAREAAQDKGDGAMAAVQETAAQAAAETMQEVVTETLPEALRRIQEDGVRDLLVQPTHLMAGGEHDRMLATLREAAAGFDRIAVGQPLLGGEEDLVRLAGVLAGDLLPEPASGGGTALVLMGHGSSEKPEANRAYRDLQETFRKLGHAQVFVATVEGSPSLSDVLQDLQHIGDGGSAAGPAAATGSAQGSSCRVLLAPLMIVAGEHARNDMAGPAPDSWENRLLAAGYQVTPVLRGLGEYPGVRAMLADHAARAQDLT